MKFTAYWLEINTIKEIMQVIGYFIALKFQVPYRQVLICLAIQWV